MFGIACQVHFSGRRDPPRRTPSPEESTFFTLPLSLIREYINYEFLDIKSKLTFKYDLEQVIDDWVLITFLLGNDFIPNLPTLFIERDAITPLFEGYKSVMPTLDGYLNECGKLNLVRFEKFISKLGEYDVKNFQDKYVNFNGTASKSTTQTAELDEGTSMVTDLSVDGRVRQSLRQKMTTNAEQMVRMGNLKILHQIIKVTTNFLIYI